MRWWPALHVLGSDERILLLLDDYAPTALEETADGLRAFFENAGSRDAAQQQFAAQGIVTTALDVPDDDWAVRSQRNLAPITVGRIAIAPDPALADADDAALSLIIRPSMGFGTGHHATTRLCLAALQTVELNGASVLDIGTGSGILAIAASRLGAARVIGIDDDPHAIEAARENLMLNAGSGPGSVQFVVADLTISSLPVVDVVVANLTGTLLMREAARLRAAADPNGLLIVSGLLADEERAVRAAFAGMNVRRRQEDEWVCLEFAANSRACGPV